MTLEFIQANAVVEGNILRCVSFDVHEFPEKNLNCRRAVAYNCFSHYTFIFILLSVWTTLCISGGVRKEEKEIIVYMIFLSEDMINLSQVQHF